MTKKTDWTHCGYDDFKEGDEIRIVTKWEDGETTTVVGTVVTVVPSVTNSVAYRPRAGGPMTRLNRVVLGPTWSIQPLWRTIARRCEEKTYRIEGLTLDELEWLKNFGAEIPRSIRSKVQEES